MSGRSKSPVGGREHLHPELREALRDLLARFPDEYHRAHEAGREAR